MSKFVIACPVCHQYVQASTGLFASRRVRCACGNIIDVKTERLASRKCPSCGNQVVFDQADGVDARCPVCQSALMVGEAVSFRCHRWRLPAERGQHGGRGGLPRLRCGERRTGGGEEGTGACGGHSGGHPL